MAHIEGSSTGRTFSLLGWIGDQLSPLTKLRDGFLVVAVIVYILGYLVWSLNAWVNNLGLLPALEFQYLVAGVFPALVIWLIYIGIRNGRRIVENLPKWLGPNVKGGLLFLRWLVRVCFYGTMCGVLPLSMIFGGILVVDDIPIIPFVGICLLLVTFPLELVVEEYRVPESFLRQ